MNILGLILLGLSVLTMVGALVYQTIDHKKGYGSTMGGEMTSGAIWSLASFLCGIGVGLVYKWYWGISAFVIVYVLSYGIRNCTERIISSFEK